MWWLVGRDQVQTTAHHQVNEEVATVKLYDHVFGAAANRPDMLSDYLSLELASCWPGNRALPVDCGARNGQPDQVLLQIACYCFYLWQFRHRLTASLRPHQALRVRR